MGANGAAPSTSGTRGQFGPFSQAIEKCRMANGLGPLAILTNPAVAGTFSTGLSTLNTYVEPSSDVAPYWPPRQSTCFVNTETQGTSTSASSALVINPSRVILALRQGLVISVLDQRYMSMLAYVRHGWLFPYAAQACRVEGILTS